MCTLNADAMLCAYDALFICCASACIDRTVRVCGRNVCCMLNVFHYAIWSVQCAWNFGREMIWFLCVSFVLCSLRDGACAPLCFAAVPIQSMTQNRRTLHSLENWHVTLCTVLELTNSSHSGYEDYMLALSSQAAFFFFFFFKFFHSDCVGFLRSISVQLIVQFGPNEQK